MSIIGCDSHSRQQTSAMLDTATGELVKRTLKHEGDNVREFYSTLPGPVRVGIEATGSMQWFVNRMEEPGIQCLVGHPAEIRAAEPRKQKHDRRDADLLLSLLVEKRFPAIWVPTRELPVCVPTDDGAATKPVDRTPKAGFRKQRSSEARQASSAKLDGLDREK